MNKLFPKLIGALLGALIFAAVGIGLAHAQQVDQSESSIAVDASSRH